jgi:hypothetical protein
LHIGLAEMANSGEMRAATCGHEQPRVNC